MENIIQPQMQIFENDNYQLLQEVNNNLASFSIDNNSSNNAENITMINTKNQNRKNFSNGLIKKSFNQREI